MHVYIIEFTDFPTSQGYWEIITLGYFETRLNRGGVLSWQVALHGVLLFLLLEKIYVALHMIL